MDGLLHIVQGLQELLIVHACIYHIASNFRVCYNFRDIIKTQVKSKFL